MSTEKDFVLHTWTRQSDWNGPTITGGRGAWFWDADGRRILDLSSQAECCNLGHQHPKVVAAIQEQAARLCYISNAWGAEPRAELARLIVEAAGGAPFGKVFFTCGGAEAIEHAIKMARWATGRHKIVARYRSYHGATHAAMSAGGDARSWNTPDGLTGAVHVLPPYCFRCPFGLAYGACGIRCAEHVEDVIRYEGPHTVAAVIAEPAAGTNGIAPPPEYWPALRDICDRHGILLIADEVMSGFGRAGAWFAWQREGSAPDLFTLAKGLTGAHVPLGAVCVSNRVAAYFDDHVLETGLTYSGHPLACAAGVAAIRAYRDEGLIERAAALGAWMFDRLRDWQARQPLIVDVRGKGLFAAVECAATPGAPPSPFPQPLPWLRQAARAALARGVSLAVRGNLLILSPPLVIEHSDLDWALGVVEEEFAKQPEQGR